MIGVVPLDSHPKVQRVFSPPLMEPFAEGTLGIPNDTL
jgi:hypothetical protein